MVLRIWHGWTTPDNADSYPQLLDTTIAPAKSPRSCRLAPGNCSPATTNIPSITPSSPATTDQPASSRRSCATPTAARWPTGSTSSQATYGIELVDD